MKPAAFSYHAPGEVAEAIELLVEHGDEAKLLAGGQSLVPLMNMRMARPGVLVDICRIGRLSHVSRNGSVVIGATTRQLTVRTSPVVRESHPVLVEALGHVGHVATQSRGTVGGSIAHADPAAELPALLLALEGEVVAEGPAGARVIPASELFVTYFTTALEPTEVLTEVRLPPLAPGTVGAFAEVARRRGDFALVGAVSLVRLAPGRHVESARIVLFGVGDVPVRARAAEDSLTGRELDEPAISEAARLAAEGISPTGDIHASSDYRREVAESRVRYVLREIAGRTEGAS